MTTDWSDLADEAKQRTLARGPKCQVQILMEHLTGEARRYVDAALDDPLVTNTGLRRALQSRLGDSPFVPALWSIGNHRRGNCRCAR